MAKIDLKFIDIDEEYTSIRVNNYEKEEIRIEIYDAIKGSTTIFLDKSTAIKFAKTLRTEINKITEVENGEG